MTQARIYRVVGKDDLKSRRGGASPRYPHVRWRLNTNAKHAGNLSLRGEVALTPKH